MAGDKYSDMGAVLPCGRTSKKNAPEQGKPRPTPPPKKPKNYDLSVTVSSGGKPVMGAKVTAAGATIDSNKAGLSKFGKKPEGDYQLTVGFGSNSDYIDLDTPINFGLHADTKREVQVELKNLVSAAIETEFDAIFLDRKLSNHQAATETKIVTDDVCKVQISFEQTNKSYPYSGKATVTCSGAGAVDMFTDTACTKAFDGSIASSDINSGKPFELYFKAKTAGKFKLETTLEDPSDPTKQKLKKAKEEHPMGVVEVKGLVYQNDIGTIKGLSVNQDQQPIKLFHEALKAVKIPEQIEMSDSDKVKKSRVLHIQENNLHARAKYVLKIDAGQWEASCDQYELYLDVSKTGGSIVAYDKEVKGSKIDLSKPILISDLKKAKGEKTFWIEGSGQSSNKMDVLLSLKLDRQAKGLAKTAKKNGDWARFTVVKVESVALNYTSVGGQANAWDAGSKKFYINMQSDPDGRKIKVKAKLSQRIEGIPLHIMLAEDKDNGTIPKMTLGFWGEKNFKTKSVPRANDWNWSTLDGSLKTKDKNARTDYLHLEKATDANGEAELELELSRFAGDKFTPACYIQEDPQLAKYIPGHSDLEKFLPKLAAAGAIEVARKFWYEIVEVEGIAIQSFAGAEGIFERVGAKMEKTANNVQVSRATVNGIVPQAIYPEYMVKLNGGNNDVLVISDSNKAQFFNGCVAEADKPIKIPILICDAQWDPDGATAEVDLGTRDASTYPLNVGTDKLIIQPCLQGGNIMVTGTWAAAEWDAAANAGAGAWVNRRNGLLSDADFSVDPARSSLYTITVSLPAAVNPVAGTEVSVKFSVNGASGPYLGEYSSATKKILAVWDPKEPVDFQNTIAHELGHAFHQVKSNYAGGLPPHKWQYVHQGSHCKYDHKDKCLMYESGPIKGSFNRFCPDCAPYVMIEDMNQLL